MNDGRVYVLGCGPSGLMAAAAAVAQGRPVAILSKHRAPSPLWGCQYLHAPIPGFTDTDPVRVQYQLEGSVTGYREKVYSDRDVEVSPEALEAEHWAWDLRRTYRRLWETFGSEVIHVPIMDGKHAAEVLPDFLREATVISTIPRPVLCAERRHKFDHQDVWAMGDSDTQRVPARPAQDNTIVCNGDPDVGWYRMSEVFGFATMEWPWRNGRKPPFSGVVPFQKPVSTECTCLPDVHYAGRYGKWEKGVLVHHVYEQVTNILSNEQGTLF